MTINDNPDLEDALDGLQEAELYAQVIGEDDLAYDIAQIYKQLAKSAPKDHWDEPDEPDDAIFSKDTMRNPDRIDPIIDLLRADWKDNPDFRLGQLVCILVPDEDPFYTEDTDLAKRLQESQGGKNPFDEMDYWTEEDDQ